MDRTMAPLWDAVALYVTTAALHRLMTFIIDGTLVRDITRDADPYWVLRQVPLITTVAEADLILRDHREGTY